MSAPPLAYRVQPLPLELSSQLCALWTTTFGYAERRNDPETVLRDKCRWDGSSESILVAVEAVEGGDARGRSPRLLGSIMVGYDGHRGWLYRLAVHPSARGRGVARHLVSEAEAVLRKHGCTKVNVQVHTHNADAAAFWRKLGYPLEERLSYGRELDA